MHDVPVLHHLAVFKFENVDDCVAAGSRLAHGMDMHDDVVAIRKDALDLAVVVGELFFEEGDEALEPFRTVLGTRVVLEVTVT